SLESKLQARLSSLGSTLYTLTWKRWITPSDVSRFRLRTSVRRTAEIETSGWVSPTSRDWKDTPGMVAQRDGKDRADQLPRQAYLARWATPTKSDTTGAETLSAKMARGAGGFMLRDSRILLAGWPTCTATDAAKRGNVSPR